MIPIVLALIGVFFVSVLPTGIYLYAEKRSRRNWIDAAGTRKRAPFLVHVAAWTGLLLGQLAIPWLLVAGECGLLLFGLAKIGRASGMISFTLIALLVAVVVQSLMSLRLFPMSIRLLANDAKLLARSRSVALGLAFANLLALAGSGLAYMVVIAMKSGHPIDRVTKATLYYGVIIPVAVFAVVGLVQAALVARAGRAGRV